MRSRISRLTTHASARRLITAAGALTLSGLCAVGQTGCGSNDGPGREAAGKVASPITSTSPDKSLIVEVGIAEIVADHITNEPGWGNTRDETYLTVVGQTPLGAADARLPLYKDNDDYYEFWNNTTRTDNGIWTNQDQVNVGPPRIWNGKLYPGQTASFQVMVQEQEDKLLHKLRQFVQGVCAQLPNAATLLGIGGSSSSGDAGADGGGSSDKVAAATSICNSLAAKIPDVTADDIIGGFQISVSNVDGQLVTVTAPISIPESATTRNPDSAADQTYKQAQLAQGRIVDTFLMSGAGSSYRVDPLVRVTPSITDPLRYLGKKSDKCRETNFDFVDTSGPVFISRDDYREFAISNTNLNWTCDGSHEHTSAATGTTDLHVRRLGDDVSWWFFKKEPIWSIDAPPPASDPPPPPASAPMAMSDRAADFDGDGKADLTMMYDFKDGSAGLFVFPGGTGSTGAPYLVWRGPFNVHAAKLTAGDFDGDGFSDVMALYDYGSASAGLLVFPGTASHAPTATAPVSVWWAPPGNFDVNLAKVTAGDFDGDGKTDVLTLYAYPQMAAGLFVFPGVQKIANSASVPYRVWYVPPWSFNVDQAKVAAGDFDGDGMADLMGLYDYGSASAGMFVWRGTKAHGDGSTTSDFVWHVDAGLFAVNQTKLSAGDFDGDGKADLMALYNYDNGYGWASAGLWVFPGASQTTMGSVTPYRTWFNPPGNFEVDWATVSAGDFTGDGKADFLSFYGYNGNWDYDGLFVVPGIASRAQDVSTNYAAWYGGAQSFKPAP